MNRQGVQFDVSMKKHQTEHPNLMSISLFICCLDNRVSHLVCIFRMSHMAECALDDAPASPVAGCWYHCVCPRFGPKMVEVLGEGLFHESFLHGVYLFMLLQLHAIEKERQWRSWVKIPVWSKLHNRSEGSKPRLASLFVRRAGIEPAVTGFEVSQRLATLECGNGVAAAAR